MVKKFGKRFIVDRSIIVKPSIPTSKDVDEMDNRLLTVTISCQEIMEIVKQPALKAPCPDDIESIFLSYCSNFEGKYVLIW